MKPIQFPESNRDLLKPDNMTDEECGSLPVFTDGRTCISCWELSEKEIELIMKEKKMWLAVLGGGTHPPVLLSADKLV